MFAAIWWVIVTVFSMAGVYACFLIAQKLVHLLGRVAGIAAFKAREKIEKHRN